MATSRVVLLLLHGVGVVVVILTSFSSGGLLGFLVGSALGMLAHLLLLFAVTNDVLRSVAHDLLSGWPLLLLLIVVVLLLLGRLRDSLAHTSSRIATITTSCRVLPLLTSTTLGSMRQLVGVIDIITSCCNFRLLLRLNLAAKVTSSPVGEARVVLSCLLVALLIITLSTLLLGLFIDGLDLVLGCVGLSATHLLVITLIN